MEDKTCSELIQTNFTNLPKGSSFTNHHWSHNILSSIIHVNLTHITKLVPDRKNMVEVLNDLQGKWEKTRG